MEMAIETEQTCDLSRYVVPDFVVRHLFFVYGLFGGYGDSGGRGWRVLECVSVGVLECLNALVGLARLETDVPDFTDGCLLRSQCRLRFGNAQASSALLSLLHDGCLLRSQCRPRFGNAQAGSALLSLLHDSCLLRSQCRPRFGNAQAGSALARQFRGDGCGSGRSWPNVMDLQSGAFGWAIVEIMFTIVELLCHKKAQQTADRTVFFVEGADAICFGLEDRNH